MKKKIILHGLMTIMLIFSTEIMYASPGKTPPKNPNAKSSIFSRSNKKDPSKPKTTEASRSQDSYSSYGDDSAISVINMQTGKIKRIPQQTSWLSSSPEQNNLEQKTTKTKKTAQSSQESPLENKPVAGYDYIDLSENTKRSPVSSKVANLFKRKPSNSKFFDSENTLPKQSSELSFNGDNLGSPAPKTNKNDGINLSESEIKVHDTTPPIPSKNNANYTEMATSTSNSFKDQNKPTATNQVVEPTATFNENRSPESSISSAKTSTNITQQPSTLLKTTQETNSSAEQSTNPFDEVDTTDIQASPQSNSPSSSASVPISFISSKSNVSSKTNQSESTNPFDEVDTTNIQASPQSNSPSSSLSLPIPLIRSKSNVSSKTNQSESTNPFDDSVEVTPSSKQPTESSTILPETLNRSFIQAAKNKTANLLRIENLHTKSGKNGEKVIETRNPKTKTKENPLGDLVSTKVEYPDGSYKKFDPKERIIEEQHRNGTVEKNIKYRENGTRLSSEVYENGILYGKSKIGERIYEQDGRSYELQDTSKLKRRIETSKFDPETNAQITQKFNKNNEITSTEIVTSNGNKTLEQNGKTTITTESGEKITIDKNGNYTMEFHGNKIAIPSSKEQIIKSINSQSKPGQTIIEFTDGSHITIGPKSKEAPDLVVTENYQAMPIKTKTFQEDGSVYSVIDDGVQKRESINNGPDITTTKSEIGNISVIETPQSGKTTVQQKDFVLEVTKDMGEGGWFGLGKSSAKTTVIDFSNFIEPLRKAKTKQKQQEIIDEMTTKLTGNKEVLNTPEYKEFKTSILNKIEQTDPTLKSPEKILTTEWINYFYKKTFSNYYKLMDVKNAIHKQATPKLQEPSNSASSEAAPIYTEIDPQTNNVTWNIGHKGKTTSSSSSTWMSENQLSPTTTAASATYQDGLLILKKNAQDAKPTIFDLTTGKTSSGKIPTSTAKTIASQVTNANGENIITITTMKSDGKTPASKVVISADGSQADFFIADKNGKFELNYQGKETPVSTITAKNGVVEAKMQTGDQANFTFDGQGKKTDVTAADQTNPWNSQPKTKETSQGGTQWWAL